MQFYKAFIKSEILGEHLVTNIHKFWLFVKPTCFKYNKNLKFLVLTTNICSLFEFYKTSFKFSCNPIHGVKMLEVL